MFKVIFSLLFSLSVIAQTSIERLEEYSISASPGTYFQDVDSELDKYAGTWVSNSACNVFTVKLQKKEMVYDGSIYRDMLIGEYSYAVNGTTIVNTLSLLDIDGSNPFNRNIQGNRFQSDNLFPSCSDCQPPNKRIKLLFADPAREYLMSTRLILQYLPSTTPQQIKVVLAATAASFLPEENSPYETRVPYGTYIMTKI